MQLGHSAVRGSTAWGKDVGRLHSLAFDCGFDAHALSLKLGVSSRQLSRQFKQAFGCTPQRWLKEQRILAAQRLLASAASVKEVAYLLGFSQVSQFCRDYRVHFGYPPSTDLGSALSVTLAPCAAALADHRCDQHVALLAARCTERLCNRARRAGELTVDD